MPTEQNEQLLEELKQKILVLIFLQKQVKQKENVLFSLRKKEFWKKKWRIKKKIWFACQMGQK